MVLDRDWGFDLDSVDWKLDSFSSKLIREVNLLVAISFSLSPEDKNSTQVMIFKSKK